MPLGQYASNIIKTDVFDQKSYYKTIFGKNHPYQITISPNIGRKHGGTDTAVTGVMSSKININMEAEYDDLDLGGMVSNLPLVGGFINSVSNAGATAFASTGQGLNNVGLFTRKFYKKGGYLRIEPEFKVVDWDGEGLPVVTAAHLLNFCVPKRGDVAESIASKLLELGITDNQIISAFQGVKSGIEGLVDEERQKKINNAFESFKDSELGKGTIEGAKNVLNEGFALTSSPTPVTVHISNYFLHQDMIIESVNVEFSDKMTKYGPIQADFKIGLSSREASSVDSMGLRKRNANRVFFGNSSEINTTGV